MYRQANVRLNKPIRLKILLKTVEQVLGVLESAKDADARRQTIKELAGSSGGALSRHRHHAVASDTATVLRDFWEATYSTLDPGARNW